MNMFGETPARRERGFLGFFARALAFSLLAGIVGPIFLIAGLAIDEPGTEWLLPIGIGVTAVDVVIAFLVARGQHRAGQRSASLRANGRIGIADITGIKETGIELNDRPVMQLSLRIHGDGIEPFDEVTSVAVPTLGQTMLGKRALAVIVDPDSRRFEIDWQGTGLLTGAVPAEFSSSEDGRTYDLSGQSAPLLSILQVLHKHGVAGEGVVDLRANPEARREVMDIVRSHVGADQNGVVDVDPVGAAPGAQAHAAKTLGARLAELEDLRIGGSITEQEYDATRQRILDSL